jgi:6-phosphogluconolactonase
MDQFVGRIEVLADPPVLAHRVAEWMTATALAAKRHFRMALSGGSTPKALYRVLASEEFRDRFPWQQVSWFWGDERFVPYDHPDSNYRMAREAMLANVPVPPTNIFPIPTDGEPEAAARRYERTLQEVYGAPTLDPSRPLFDIVLLGMGPDGHTASLLSAIRAGRSQVPAARVRPVGELIWFADRAAAAENQMPQATNAAES